MGCTTSKPPPAPVKKQPPKVKKVEKKQELGPHAVGIIICNGCCLWDEQHTEDGCCTFAHHETSNFLPVGYKQTNYLSDPENLKKQPASKPHINDCEFYMCSTLCCGKKGSEDDECCTDTNFYPSTYGPAKYSAWAKPISKEVVEVEERKEEANKDSVSTKEMNKTSKPAKPVHNAPVPTKAVNKIINDPFLTSQHVVGECCVVGNCWDEQKLFFKHGSKARFPFI